MHALQRILLSALILMLFPASKAWTGEVRPNYMPLKMSFYYYGSPSCWGSLSADKIVHVFRPGHRPEMYSGPLIVEGPALYAPSPENWQAFFDICESADIWNLGKENCIISGDIARRPMWPCSWSLNLEYPDRKLTITGEEKFVDIDIAHAMGLPGEDVEYSDARSIISDNLNIAMEYEKLQSVWDAFGKYVIMGKKFPLLRKYN